MIKSPRWATWGGIGLGAWLLASPWAIGFSQQRAPTVNALLGGMILVIGELFDLLIRKRHRRPPRGGNSRGSKARNEAADREAEPLLGLS